MRWKQIALTMTLAVAMLPAGAQTTDSNAALVAKANSGDAAAQVAVGEHYAASAADLRNAAEAAEAYKQAEAWYRKAAEQGFLAGEMHLAALYRDGGKGFPRDMAEAVVWYRKAAEQGDVTAQGTLGVLYSIGQGVEKNDVEAYFWLDVAASAKGPKQAQYAQNRQLVGTHVTTDELEEVQERVAKWLAAHPRPATKED
jgi:TPR repeat protein